MATKKNLKMWQKSKTQNVTKLKNLIGDKTQKLKIELKYNKTKKKCDKTKKKIKLWQTLFAWILKPNQKLKLWEEEKKLKLKFLQNTKTKW